LAVRILHIFILATVTVLASELGVALTLTRLHDSIIIAFEFERINISDTFGMHLMVRSAFPFLRLESMLTDLTINSRIRPGADTFSTFKFRISKGIAAVEALCISCLLFEAVFS
jgi:hypothetical protein